MPALKAFVTGATGFIGRHLVQELIGNDWVVEALRRPGSLKQDDCAISWYEHSGDIMRLRERLERFQPDVVLHLASLYIKEHKPEHVASLIASNIALVSELAEAMSLAGIRRLINTGTAWQHATGGAYRPVNLYAATKQASESILAYYQDAGLIDTIHLHLFDTYGPGDPRPKVFTVLQRAAQSGAPLSMTPGEQLIDLVHVSDVANGFRHVAESHCAGRLPAGAVYGISSGKPMPLRQIVSIWQKQSAIPVSIIWGGIPYGRREVMVPWMDPPSPPDWRPSVGLAEGLGALRRPDEK